MEAPTLPAQASQAAPPQTPQTPPPNIFVNKRYRLCTKIGQGGNGVVFLAFDIEKKQDVAVKLRPTSGSNVAQMDSEAMVIDDLSGAIGMPRFLWYGQERDHFALVQELLGPSLHDLWGYCGGFSLKTVLMIARQAIRRLKHVHDRGYLHGDLKPDNFLFGIGKKADVLYLIDFGLCQDMDSTTGLAVAGHTPCTLRFASLKHDKGQPQSRGGDLESLGYVLILIARGHLPWSNLEAQKDRVRLIKRMRARTSIEDLCQGLPEEFKIYMEYVRGLEPLDKPAYGLLRRMFNRLFLVSGFQHDKMFDWKQRSADERLKGRAPSTAAPRDDRTGQLQRSLLT